MDVQAMKGVVKKIPDNIREQVRSEYINLTGREDVNFADFEEIFGVSMLDVTAGNGEHISIIFISGIFMIVNLFIYFGVIRLSISRRVRTRETIRNTTPGMINHVINTLTAEDTISCYEAQIYLTNEYFVALNYGLMILRYHEIKEIYYTLKMKSSSSSNVRIYLVEKGKRRKIIADTGDKFDTRREVQSIIDETRYRIKQEKV